MTVLPASTDILTLRAWARARLVVEGKMTLLDAVDDLQGFAVRSGIVRRLGQDEVQRIVAAAFMGRSS